MRLPNATLASETLTDKLEHVVEYVSTLVPLKCTRSQHALDNGPGGVEIACNLWDAGHERARH